MIVPRRAWMLAREAGDGSLVLRDPAGDREHHLNAVAAFVWHCCDGARDEHRIARKVAARYGKRVPEVSGDVGAVLAQFAQAGIVRLASGARRETDMLLRCVRAALGTSRSPAASTLGALDWNDVIQTASEHGVLPLVYRGLTITGDLVPRSALERLRRGTDAIAAQNRRLLDELVAVLDAMERAGVQALSLKGPTLAHEAYGDIGLRSFGDLDVFVRASQASDAIALLRSRGYRVRAHGETDVYLEVRRPDGVSRIDLQWAVSPGRFRSPLDLEQLWTRLERRGLGSAVVWQPQPCDQILFLCAHGAKHCWSRLQWLADVAAYAGRADRRLDWDDARQRAAHAGGLRQLLLGARLAHQLLGAPVPAPLVDAMRTDLAVGPLASELQDRLFESCHHVGHFQGTYGPYRGGWFYVRTRERLRDRLPYLAHLSRRPMQRLKAKTAAFVYRLIAT